MILALIHKGENEVNFFTPEKLLEAAMELAIENEFELDVGNPDGWDTTMISDEGFVKSWRDSVSQEDKLTAAEEVLSVFGYTVVEAKKEQFNVVLNGTKHFTFISLFEDCDDDCEPFDQGVAVRVEIDGDDLGMVYFTSELNTFEKNYELPDIMGKDAYFGEVVIDKERMEVKTISKNGTKGFVTFHFNGEGTMYNNFYTEGQTEGFDELEGYFEVEDMHKDEM